MDYVRQEFYYSWLEDVAIDSDGIEGFGNIEEYRACYSIFALVPSYIFNDAGQLPGSQPKLLVSHQSALAEFT